MHQRGEYSEYVMPTFSRNSGPLCGGLRPQDDGVGSHLTVETPPLIPMPQVKYEPGGGVPGDTLVVFNSDPSPPPPISTQYG